MPDVVLKTANLTVVLSATQGFVIKSLTHVKYGNVIDAYDDGRCGLNTSVYGAENYGSWNGRPWAFNPIQGGSWTNEGAPVVASQRKISATEHACSIIPTDWSTSTLQNGFRFDQNISIRGDVVICKTRIRQLDPTIVGPERHQEVCAWFLKRQYSRLKTDLGFQTMPNIEAGQGNGYYNIVNPVWGMTTSNNSHGVWFRHSSTKLLTGYVTGKRSTDKGACAYIAPLDIFALGGALDRSYETRVFVGTEADMQKKL